MYSRHINCRGFQDSKRLHRYVTHVAAAAVDRRDIFLSDFDLFLWISDKGPGTLGH